MSKRFWSADYHLSHANIVRYCNRPTLRKTDLDEKGNWISPEIAIEAAERQDKFIIRNHNQRVKPEDTVIHLGDFMNRGRAKGVEGLRNKYSDYVEQLNGTFVNIRGNHDDNNSTKSIGDYLIASLGPYTVFVSHYPIENTNRFSRDLMNFILKHTSAQLCGHIHNSWTHKFFQHSNGKYLMYNVGIDVHKYAPISDNEVIENIMKIIKAS